MPKPIHFVLAATLFAAPFLSAAEEDEDELLWPGLRKRVQQITMKAVTFLKDFTISGEVKLCDSWDGRVQFQKEHWMPRRDHGGCYEGLLYISDAQWMYFIVETNHSDFDSNLVFAVDQDRNLYRVRTHVCGTLRLTDHGAAPDSVEAVLKTEQQDAKPERPFSMGMYKRVKWEKISEEELAKLAEEDSQRRRD
ncbi:MAG TPA: hypothetical protein VGP72_22755 [Planctomycetota bacterium]|jgi:hypothetical protein